MTSNPTHEHLVTRYGDLVYDFCHSTLRNTAHAHAAFRQIFREVQKTHVKNAYTAYERAWVLRISSRRLLALLSQRESKQAPAEQIELDSNPNVAARLKNFDFYFHRLESEDQVLLLFRDKYGLPFTEIATALGVPEDSLKIRRQQALRRLEEWVWGGQ